MSMMNQFSFNCIIQPMHQKERLSYSQGLPVNRGLLSTIFFIPAIYVPVCRVLPSQKSDYFSALDITLRNANTHARFTQTSSADPMFNRPQSTGIQSLQQPKLRTHNTACLTFLNTNILYRLMVRATCRSRFQDFSFRKLTFLSGKFRKVGQCNTHSLLS